LTLDRLSIQAIFWQLMVVDLNVTYTELNRAMSVNFVGLAMGCVLFIPLAKKFGRRPVYLVSTALMLVTSFWASKLTRLSELYATNLLQGLAGATNESIVQITVCMFVIGSTMSLANRPRSPISFSYITAGG
jgi:MFS family permease